jgi:signal transduction histidine kinase
MASLGQLVAGVDHELKNPASFVHGGLANLKDHLAGFTEVLAAYESGSDAVAARARVDLPYLVRETPSLLRICTEGSERIKRIVDDLRLFARTDGGERAVVDLREGVESTLRLLGPRIARDRVAIERDLAPGAVRVVGHAGQLNQIWMNLIANALDAVRECPQPVVRVRVAAIGDRAEVEVADNGAGMTTEIVARAFEPFFTTKAVGHGTGLGLSIARGAVENHGGEITVASEPRRGTRMIVRLPVDVPPARAAAEAAR